MGKTSHHGTTVMSSQTPLQNFTLNMQKLLARMSSDVKGRVFRHLRVIMIMTFKCVYDSDLVYLKKNISPVEIFLL